MDKVTQLLWSKYNYSSLNWTNLEYKTVQSLRNIKGCSMAKIKQQECTTRAEESSHQCPGCKSNNENKFHVCPPLWWMTATWPVQTFICLFSLQSLLVGYVSLGIRLRNRLHFRRANSFKGIFVNKWIFYKGHAQGIYQKANFQTLFTKKQTYIRIYMHIYVYIYKILASHIWFELS